MTDSADTLTLLQAKPGCSTAKIISPSGMIGFNAGMYFGVEQARVGGVRDLADVLTEAANPEHRLLVIRGEPMPQALAWLAKNPGRGVRRKKKAFAERPRRWALIDFDSARVEDCDLVRDPEGAVRAVVERYLPDYFHDVTCFWQLSSRAGLDPGIVKVHLWFWFDRAVGGQEGSKWAEACAPTIDRSLFRQVQPHYIARPVFRDMPDPLPRRTGLLVGSREEVALPLDWQATAPPEPPEGAARVIPAAFGSYETRMVRLGDGEGLGGFHEVLLGAIWSYLVSGRTDLDWLKADVRARVAGAPVSPARRVEDLERYVSDEYLDDSIRGAQQKIEEGKKSIRLSMESLQRFAKKLAAKADDQQAEVGVALGKVCKGEAFADEGTAEYLVPKIVKTLADRFSDYDPDSIARLFGQSVGLMPGVTVEGLAYEIRSKQQAIVEEQSRKERDDMRRINEIGRTSAYTPEELASFPLNIGQQWIIQRDKSFYLFVDGEYVGPYSRDDVLNAAVRDLAPARSAGVELFKLNKQGDVVQKSINQLVQQYGTVAKSVMLDLRAQKTSYDAQEFMIIEAPCPIRAITPTYHPAIDRWLQVMAGSKYEILKTWLAAICWLDYPCVALFLTGPKDTGKNMLALGVSRIWTTTRPTSLEEAFDNFNDSLARCPLCFADEQLPKDHRGYTKNAELRNHIQAIQRPYKRKFHPNATLVGATRTIIAANNEEVLSTPENLSANDIEAIIDRYLHIETQREAIAYLQDVNTHALGWVDEDKIAEHVLWLGLNHEWTPKGRFLIPIEDEHLHRSFATKTGSRSAICQWLIGYLLNPRKFDAADSGMLVRIKNKKLLVNVQGLLKFWDFYVGNNERCPSAGHLSSALAALCENEGKKDGRLQYPDEKGQRVAYRVVNIENLIAWAEEKGFADRERIEAALSNDSEEKKARFN